MSRNHRPEPPATVEEGVSETWDLYWERRSPLRPGGERLVARAYLRLLDRMGGAREMTRVVLGAVGPVAGKSVLDAGCGTGLGSRPFYDRGARLTLMDTSASALAIASSSYPVGGRVEFVQGSVFRLPFPDHSFDVVFNTGLLEHFPLAERRLALAEMLRVMRDDGVAVTVNPCAGARLYVWCKARAERAGTWDVGFEEPIGTLSDCLDEGEYELDERSSGLLMQLHFVRYLLPRWFRVPVTVAAALVQTLLAPLNRRPGYLLVSAIRRRDAETTSPL